MENRDEETPIDAHQKGVKVRACMCVTMKEGTSKRRGQKGRSTDEQTRGPEKQDLLLKWALVAWTCARALVRAWCKKNKYTIYS